MLVSLGNGPKLLGVVESHALVKASVVGHLNYCNIKSAGFWGFGDDHLGRRARGRHGDVTPLFGDGGGAKRTSAI